MKNTHFKKSALCLAVSTGLALPQVALAAEEESAKDQGIETIQVTASRRSSTIQETPINVTALDGDVMADQNITQLADVARWVPGLTVQDQGGRSAPPIIVRGLNTNSSGPGADGGTVATYVGEIPLAIDLKILDVERVEVLIGPQGTLYGAGTLGGAIRYMPKKPVLDETSGSVYGDIFNIAQSDDLGSEAGFVVNTPIIEDTLGVRVAFNHLDEPGFIDYNYVVRESGVSLPDPDWNNPDEVAANLKQVKDANFDKATTARVMLRWQPNEMFDATLSYHYQKQEIGSRSITHYGSLSDTNPLSAFMGKYESGYRYEEPFTREDSLISLELTADLGFAELTSATGFTDHQADGQRDQTDLLIRLDYSYEEFPAFSAFTRETEDDQTITQEIRLVSTSDSALSWIVGGFYNKFDGFNDSKEFTPGFDQFAVDNWAANQLRPDSLEYISVGDDVVEEMALFGELSYDITDALSVTVGTRFYNYSVESTSGIDLPLFYTLFGDYGPDEINIDLSTDEAEDDGNLFKFNVSYQVSEDVLTYFTISEGFRIGGANGVAACPDNIDDIDNQIVCALPDEVIYTADTTTNYEFGLKSTWFNNKLHFNSALFYVEWDDAQVAGATVNGQQPITSNAGAAESKGIEIATRALITDELIAYATYAYTQAELSEDAQYLFGVPSDPNDTSLDAFAGDRLPGSPENQFSLGLTYSTEIFEDKGLDVTYGLTYQDEYVSKVGLRNFGEVVPGYALSNLNAKFSDESWAVTLYIDNMFDKYAFSSVRRDFGDITVRNDPALQRNYGHYLVTPRKIGLRFEYFFDL
ncbi:TonB-dependent receptor [Thalassotalea agarivorans]|uniref:Outer membrane receptor proteins, mostly Fe transport n=1 Tax=Thalassotalea agarivorans TaxID=349064 RepID=A0A1I0FFX3_THASX|nr:TonB-dependent receptor [Thalassotalea agarivorans]SET57190.1 Outer membrane receptor proteins, mostly Fe transport [Thalassotalea agarivorans]